MATAITEEQEVHEQPRLLVVSTGRSAVQELVPVATVDVQKSAERDEGVPVRSLSQVVQSTGRQLAEHGLAVLDRQGARRIKAVTKIEEEDSRINPFWEGYGFRPVGRMVRFGHERNVLVRTWKEPDAAPVGR